MRARMQGCLFTFDSWGLASSETCTKFVEDKCGGLSSGCGVTSTPARALHFIVRRAEVRGNGSSFRATQTRSRGLFCRMAWHVFIGKSSVPDTHGKNRCGVIENGGIAAIRRSMVRTLNSFASEEWVFILPVSRRLPRNTRSNASRQSSPPDRENRSWRRF